MQRREYLAALTSGSVLLAGCGGGRGAINRAITDTATVVQDDESASLHVAYTGNLGLRNDQEAARRVLNTTATIESITDSKLPEYRKTIRLSNYASRQTLTPTIDRWRFEELQFENQYTHPDATHARQVGEESIAYRFPVAGEHYELDSVSDNQCNVDTAGITDIENVFNFEYQNYDFERGDIPAAAQNPFTPVGLNIVPKAQRYVGTDCYTISSEAAGRDIALNTVLDGMLDEQTTIADATQGTAEFLTSLGTALRSSLSVTRRPTLRNVFGVTRSIEKLRREAEAYTATLGDLAISTEPPWTAAVNDCDQVSLRHITALTAIDRFVLVPALFAGSSEQQLSETAAAYRTHLETERALLEDLRTVLDMADQVSNFSIPTDERTLYLNTWTVVTEALKSVTVSLTALDRFVTSINNPAANPPVSPTPTATPEPVSDSFVDEFETGAIRDSSLWSLTLTDKRATRQKEATAEIVTESAPDGGNHSLSFSVQNGGRATATTRETYRWDAPWLVEGLFKPVLRNNRFASAYIGLLGGEVVLQLEFNRQLAKIVPRNFFVESSQTEIGEWRNDVWYAYDCEYDGESQYTCTIWEAAQPRPTSPTVTTTGKQPGNGTLPLSLAAYAGGDIAVNHAYIRYSAGEALK